MKYKTAKRPQKITRVIISRKHSSLSQKCFRFSQSNQSWSAHTSKSYSYKNERTSSKTENKELKSFRHSHHVSFFLPLQSAILFIVLFSRILCFRAFSFVYSNSEIQNVWESPRFFLALILVILNRCYPYTLLLPERAMKQTSHQDAQNSSKQPKNSLSLLCLHLHAQCTRRIREETDKSYIEGRTVATTIYA